jgi:hypothetical protein
MAAPQRRCGARRVRPAATRRRRLGRCRSATAASWMRRCRPQGAR